MLTDLGKKVIDASIQNLIMAREAYRSNPELFPVKGTGHKPAVIVTLGVAESALVNETDSIPSNTHAVYRFYKRVIHWFRIRNHPI